MSSMIDMGIEKDGLFRIGITISWNSPFFRLDDSVSYVGLEIFSF